MAFTFPMSVTDFFNKMPITVSSFDLGDALEHNETGGGEILSADLGNRLWRMECELVPDYHYSIDACRALLDVLRYAGRSLIAYPPYYNGPASDKNGSILGGSTVTMTAVQSNNRDIRLEGLPDGYVISPGDYISWQYGSNPVRYALHRFATGGTASSGGVSPLMELSSFARLGYTLPVTVKLIKPEVKMVLVPGSVNAGTSRSLITSGVRFTLTQTLR